MQDPRNRHMDNHLACTDKWGIHSAELATRTLSQAKSFVQGQSTSPRQSPLAFNKARRVGGWLFPRTSRTWSKAKCTRLLRDIAPCIATRATHAAELECKSCRPQMCFGLVRFCRSVRDQALGPNICPKLAACTSQKDLDPSATASRKN